MDKKIEKLLENEEKRQNSVINLIASENYASESIMKLQGSILTNKYAEGYSNKRYYGGCENVDAIEELAISYACKLFNCKYANVQAHSGSTANMAVYKALLNIGDKILSMNLSSGGHLTHGHNMSFSGKEYNIINYEVNKETGLIDYEELINIAKREKPSMIIVGASAYSRIIDFKKFREAADTCGAYLMADIAHISGLVAAGVHPSPFPYADIITSTTHKTLRGPRGGLILTNNEEIIKKINRTVFPGIQGGPLMHVIAAKAQCFYEAMKSDFKEYQHQVLKNMKAMEEVFRKNNIKMISNGTDNHLLLIDVYNTFGITGRNAQEILESVGIILNKNTIPFETLSPSMSSGIRIGSPAMTTKGFKEKDFELITTMIIEILNKYKNNHDVSPYKEKVSLLMNKIIQS